MYVQLYTVLQVQAFLFYTFKFFMVAGVVVGHYKCLDFLFEILELFIKKKQLEFWLWAVFC